MPLGVIEDEDTCLWLCDALVSDRKRACHTGSALEQAILFDGIADENWAIAQRFRLDVGSDGCFTSE
jgi:hypothetical protein